jgi:PAS domain S-box-containing protein
MSRPKTDRRGDGRPAADPLRSVAQLDMLHNLAATLNSLRDVREIGEAIATELRTIIDYHNCRVYVLDADGATLDPIAFRGRLHSEYEGETLEELITLVGEGITGHVAATRESFLTPDAREVEFGILIEGTDDILESMLAVPMVAGDDLIGVIVLSSLGYGMFDDIDRRLCEVLGSHAAVAIANARLLEAEREAAATSKALLRLSKVLTGRRSIGDILQEALETVTELLPVCAAAAHVRDEETGGFRLARVVEAIDGSVRPRSEIADIPAEVAAPFLFGDTKPFVVSADLVADIPLDYRCTHAALATLAVPLEWEPDGFGGLALVAAGPDTLFTDRDVTLARGIGDIASLALGNARRISELERFHELVEDLDAVFWEAEVDTLTFAFVRGRADALLGDGAAEWPALGRRWGDHIAPDDRAPAISTLREAIASGSDRSIEYRLRADDGRVTWIRDLVRVTNGRGGRPQLRGLMVDVTDRKRAEQALRESERQASDAYRREREAAQQLRALDEMKNTFLEAVSHDLRTPLTSILGSAITLERATDGLTVDDMRDLARRIAANARKLERLLSNLLDLDRLQRGIVSPQRSATSIPDVIRRVLGEIEHPRASRVELDPSPITVSVDGGQVERIVENLVMNAIRHTPEETRILVRAVPQDGGVLLTVDDDGPGIPPALREAIFEPFRQAPGSTSEHAPGVGIGLSLVRRFAELHGGRAWAEEREGGGASFRVFLPGG